MAETVIGYVFDNKGYHTGGQYFEGTMENIASFIMINRQHDTTRLEFDVSGHLCNIDYAKLEILIGQILAVYILRQIIRVIYQLFLAAKSAVTAYIENGAAGKQSNMYLAVSGVATSI